MGNVRVREVRAEYVSLPSPLMSVTGPEALARIFFEFFQTFRDPQENVLAAYLDSRGGLLGVERVYRGTLNFASAATRDVLRNALVMSAVSVLIGHNHPSGDPNPSADDILFTRRLIDAGRLLNIDVVDHLVLGTTPEGVLRFTSIKQRGVI